MRLGLHVHVPESQDAELRRYVELVRPELMKWLNSGVNEDTVRFCHERGALCVLRVYQEVQSLSQGKRKSYIKRVVSDMRDSLFHVAEGYNEQFQTPDEMVDRAQFDIELMQAMQDIGKKAAIGSFSTGQPEMNAWEPYMPALEFAAENGHYVALHEYSAPVMQYGVGDNQWNGGCYALNDPADDHDELGWWTLRYRRHVAVWRQLGLATIPQIIITESGIDDIQPRPGPAGKGWRDYHCRDWGCGIPGGRDFGDYADQWRWYLKQLWHDPYIAGICDFGWKTDGNPNPGIANWCSFDLAADTVLLERMIAAMRDLPHGTCDDGGSTGPGGGGLDIPSEHVPALLHSSDENVSVPLNPAAALLRRIFEDEYIPTSDEFDVEINGTEYVAQRAEDPVNLGRVRVYAAVRGEWFKVGHVDAEHVEPAENTPPARKVLSE